MADLVNVGASTETGDSGAGNIIYFDVGVQQTSEVEGLGFCKMKKENTTMRKVFKETM